MNLFRPVFLVFILFIHQYIIAFGPRHYSFETQERFGNIRARAVDEERDTYIKTIVGEMTPEELSMFSNDFIGMNEVYPLSPSYASPLDVR